MKVTQIKSGYSLQVSKSEFEHLQKILSFVNVSRAKAIQPKTKSFVVAMSKAMEAPSVAAEVVEPEVNLDKAFPEQAGVDPDLLKNAAAALNDKPSESQRLDELEARLADLEKNVTGLHNLCMDFVDEPAIDEKIKQAKTEAINDTLRAIIASQKG